MTPETPLYRALNEYLERDMARFHMPGHKGRPLRGEDGPDPMGGAWRYDLTEAEGMDSLYEAHGALLETEEAYARLYGSRRTLLSAGGSSLCIQAMLALAARPGGRVIAGRNMHSAALHAMALLDLTPVWVYPDGGAGCGMGGRVHPEEVERLLRTQQNVCAVYVTTPDYFGVLSDVAAIAGVCRRFGVPLLVDNAHGAHLKFQAPSLHPMDLGASMCCDSLHKTLPVLTGGALLHIADQRFVEDAKQRMALFGSTSPSYLIMLSIDRCLGLLQRGVEADFAATRRRVRELEELAEKRGFVRLLGPRDETKLVLSVYNWGMSGEEFGGALRSCGMEPEYVGEMWAVLMAGPETTEEEYARVERFLRQWDRPPVRRAPAYQVIRPERVMDLRAAVFAPSEWVELDRVAGRVAAAMVNPCPPGIPVVIPGERVREEQIKVLKISGTNRIKVVK